MNPYNRYAATVAWVVLMCAGATGALGQADSRKPDTEWRGYNGGYDATRVSPLTKNDPKNVASLQEVVQFRLPDTMSFQHEPNMTSATHYVTTTINTYANDRRTESE